MADLEVKNEAKHKQRGSITGLGDGDDGKVNLWQQLLHKASRQNAETNTTLIVLGDAQNGKSSLLKKFRNRVARDAKQVSTPYLVDFSFCNVNNIYDENDPDEVRAQMNVWELDGAEAAKSLLPRFLASTSLDKVVYMITLDLSKPWSLMSSLQTWIDVLTEAHNKIFGELTEDQQTQLKDSITRFNQFYVDPSVADEDDAPAPTEDMKLEEGVPEMNLGVPLVIAGCKGDSLHDVFARQSGVGDRFEYMTRHLREFALKYGASLMYTSAMGTNCDLLQDWIYHRLYNFEWKHHAVVVGNSAEYAVNVPSGYDSVDLIASIQPARASWDEDATFEQVFVNAEKKVRVNAQTEAEVKAEDNDVFFKTLKFNHSGGREQKRKRAAESKAGRAKSVFEKIKGDGQKKGGDQRAVKDFFRSLLSEQQKGKSSDRRRQASEALSALKNR